MGVASGEKLRIVAVTAIRPTELVVYRGLIRGGSYDESTVPFNMDVRAILAEAAVQAFSGDAGAEWLVLTAEEEIRLRPLIWRHGDEIPRYALDLSSGFPLQRRPWTLPSDLKAGRLLLLEIMDLNGRPVIGKNQGYHYIIGTARIVDRQGSVVWSKLQEVRQKLDSSSLDFVRGEATIAAIRAFCTELARKWQSSKKK